MGTLEVDLMSFLKKEEHHSHRIFQQKSLSNKQLTQIYWEKNGKNESDFEPWHKRQC